jgi:hypothetical protein
VIGSALPLETPWLFPEDESVWRYSITLKNIITAGNLNRAVSLF